MFEFVMDDVPPQTLEVAKAEISLYAQVPPWRDRISLYVEVIAKPQTVTVGEDEDDSYQIEPRFYTEWLDIRVDQLRGRGLDLLDGYQMAYDVATEQEDGYDQFPGAVYQDMHAGFTRATMKLTHLGGAGYRIEAEGETEFGWRFRIDTQGVLAQVSAKSGQEGGDAEPSAEIEDWFARLYDPRVFPPSWVRNGGGDNHWYVFKGLPSAD